MGRHRPDPKSLGSRRVSITICQLRLEIEGEAFFVTLKEFIQRNLHGTAEVEQLRAVAEQISGQDLTAFFTAGVTQPVVPDLTATNG